MKKRVVNKTRNNGTWTESMYFAAIRSALRSKFRYWKPIILAKKKAERKYKGPNKRQQFEYQCNNCKKWFKSTDVEVDHIIECGKLNCYEDIVPFLKRLTIENINGFQVLCKPCHKDKTKLAKK